MPYSFSSHTFEYFKEWLSTEHEPPHDKTNKMAAPSEDSDQPGHPPSQSDQSLRCPHEEILGP